MRAYASRAGDLPSYNDQAAAAPHSPRTTFTGKVREQDDVFLPPKLSSYSDRVKR